MYQDQMEKYGFVPMNHDTPHWFNVIEEPVVTLQGVEIPGYKRVLREDTGDTLAVHSDQYRIIQDKDVFEAFEAGVNASGLDITDLAVKRDRSANGTQTFSRYVLPAVTETVGQTKVSLSFLCWNSHDGTMAANGRIGFYTWVCANQSVQGKDLGAFSIRHKGEHQEVSVAVENLVAGAGEAIAQMRRFEQWRRTEVLDATARALLNEMPQKSKALVTQLFYDWSSAKEDTGPNGGANLWAFWSVLTFWATNGIGLKQGMERQKRIAQLETCDLFKRLAN